MYRYQFEKKARWNRTKALFVAITFHALILGAVLYGSSENWQEWIPQQVQEMLGMTGQEEMVAEVPKP